MTSIALIDGAPGSSYTLGLDALAAPLQKYCNLVARAWGCPAVNVFYAKNIKVADPAMWWLTVNLHSDMPGALGYHDDHPNGLPFGEVFAADDADAGASLSVTLAHEAAEIIVDPWINNLWHDGNRYWLREVGDPVEDDLYGIEVDGVLMSNFVLPHYYSIRQKGPYDYGGRLKSGCPTLLSGGYISYMQGGQWHQIAARHANGSLSYRALRYGRSARAATYVGRQRRRKR